MMEDTTNRRPGVEGDAQPCNGADANGAISSGVIAEEEELALQITELSPRWEPTFHRRRFAEISEDGSEHGGISALVLGVVCGAALVLMACLYLLARAVDW